MSDSPRGLGELLSAAGWKRCEPVLSAAFSGVPAEVRGRITFRSGAPFCRHVMCTSLPLAGDLQAVLVQFDMAETVPATGAGPSRRAPPKRPALPAELLEHFPDDIVIFDGCESAEEKAVMLLELIGSDREAGFLIEAIAGLEGDAPQTLYLPEGSGLETAGYAAVRQMCEIRLVPTPSLQEAENGGRPAMAIIRHNVDCPHEVAENRRLAYLDPLTGLENRRAFTKVLERELKRLAADTETGLAVFYIDLDEFKKVNDLGGHDAGDDMLLRVAACLRLTLGEFGTAARIGGDEFAGMLPAANKEAALDVAERILDGFDRIRLEVGERVFTIGGSVGIAFVEGAMPLKQLDASVLLGLADRACLRGKRFGGQSVQLHAVQSNDCAEGGEVAALPEPGSFRGNELTLYTMPIMCLKKNRICGSEVLLRLQGERAHELSSRAWISAAERSGFIAQVDAWTLDKVLDAADKNPSRVTLTMNVSAESARDPLFRDGLSQRLSVNPLLAAKLCLEIAEKDFLREPATVESFFKFVSGLGCQTAIDDFAGHWPVLSRLTGLRVEWLKLDPGLTQQVADEPAKAAILNGLVRAAHELGIKVVAKHVESAEEADLLRELDIEAAQGFHFGRPEPWPDAGAPFGRPVK
ncbi:EAL domain-containing protein [Roseibium salinum]|uniref:EAL domain-containing protein n=1 Tax=Roseibium salinum TaxID=1604349 RepID=UPI0035EF9DA1